jgi:hypothetical protein
VSGLDDYDQTSERGPPFDTEYGQRELHVRDLDALLISFGQKIETE